MSAPAEPGPLVWPARDAPPDELLERAHRLWKELTRRGEALASSWVEDAARDLKSGELPGLWLPGGSGAPGLAVYSLRRQRVFAHVHVDEGPDRAGRAGLLVRSLVASLPAEARRADIGLSGLSGPEEAALGSQLVADLGGTIIVRRALEREIGPEDSEEAPSPLVGARTYPVRSIETGPLAQLDWRAFQGTADANLVADTIEEDQRGLEELLAGRLGRFLDEASLVLAGTEDRLVGAILVSEQDPEHAMVCDLMVDPSVRRQGIATFLLRRAMRALHALGYRFLRLWVTEANLPARGLYERFRFAVVSTARIYRWEPGAGTSEAQSHRER